MSSPIVIRELSFSSINTSLTSSSPLLGSINPSWVVDWLNPRISATLDMLCAWLMLLWPLSQALKVAILLPSSLVPELNSWDVWSSLFPYPWDCLWFWKREPELYVWGSSNLSHCFSVWGLMFDAFSIFWNSRRSWFLWIWGSLVSSFFLFRPSFSASQNQPIFNNY